MRKTLLTVITVLLSLLISPIAYAEDLPVSVNRISFKDRAAFEEPAEAALSCQEPESDLPDNDGSAENDIGSAEDVYTNPAMDEYYSTDDIAYDPTGDELYSLIPQDRKRPSGFTADMWKELRLINAQRHKAGEEPLAGLNELQKIAAVRAGEIKKLFSHTRPDGSDCFSAFNIPYMVAGENIAIGYSSVADAMDAWMHSPGHKANILYHDFTHVGIGINGKHYSQNFATPWDTSCSIFIRPDQRIIKKKGKISSLGIVVMLKDGYGYSYLPLEDYMCTGYDNTTEGLYDVTISIRGCTATFPLIVSANGKNITIDELPETDPDKDAYTAVMATGQTLSPESYISPSINAAKYSITMGKQNITFSKKAKITARKAGYAIITVYEKENYIYRAASRYLIKIENPKFKVKSLSLNAGDTENIMSYLGGIEELEPSSFTSSRPAVATVDPETGVITGIKKGNAKITVLFNNGEKTVKRSITVKVKN